MTKSEIRQLIKQRKAACSAEERAALSSRVIAALQQHPRWISAHTTLLYHSLPDEVDTHGLILDALAQGKRVLLPVVSGDELELHELLQHSSLREGAFHILEPTGPLFSDFASIDLAVIPGVAFTPDGRRLGRGRGYYDRLLSHFTPQPSTLNHQPSTINPQPSTLNHHPSPYTLGLAYPFQILDDIPTEPHDIRLDEVISVNPL